MEKREIEYYKIACNKYRNLYYEEKKKVAFLEKLLNNSVQLNIEKGKEIENLEKIADLQTVDIVNLLEKIKIKNYEIRYLEEEIVLFRKGL